jgi:hypothetical protein
MTLDEILQARLTEWKPPDGRQTLSVSDPASGWSVSLTADRHDTVGCLAWELAVRHTSPAGELAAWAAKLADRVTGLVEPLKVHEVDAARNEALLRSETPSQRGADLFYFEVHLQGTGAAVLRRYQASHKPGEARKQVAFAVTYEVLGKLVRDLTAA